MKQFSHITPGCKILHRLPRRTSLKQRGFNQDFLWQDWVYSIYALTEGGCLAGDICDAVVFFFIRVHSVSCLLPPKYRHRSGAAELGYIYCQEFKPWAVLTKTSMGSKYQQHLTMLFPLFMSSFTYALQHQLYLAKTQPHIQTIPRFHKYQWQSMIMLSLNIYHSIKEPAHLFLFYVSWNWNKGSFTGFPITFL